MLIVNKPAINFYPRLFHYVLPAHEAKLSTVWKALN